MITANATLSAGELASNIESGCGGLAAGLFLAIAVISTLCILLILGGD